MPTTTTQHDLAARLRATPEEHLSPYARTHRASLLQSFVAFGRWTPNQEQMVRRWVDQARAPAAPAEQIAGAGLDRLHALFALARSNGLQRPRISVSISAERRIDMSPSRDGEALHVRSAGEFLGSLRRGVFYASLEAARAGLVVGVEDGLRRMAADPAAEATAYGRLTGSCCFCRRPLTDGRSIAVGYGPICADHYGLAWGDERVQVQNVAVTGVDLAAGADRSATFTRVDRARVRAERVRADIAAAQRREDAELSTGITAQNGAQIEREMDAMFAVAERQSEQRGFESDPDYRASWRNELAR